MLNFEDTEDQVKKSSSRNSRSKKKAAGPPFKEKPYRKSQELLKLITDALPALISYVDKDERYRFNNREYERSYGYSGEQIYGMHVRDVLGEEAYRNIASHIQTALTGKQVTYEQWFRHRDGNDRYRNVNYIPDISEEGDVRGFCVLVNDLTERMQMEEALRSYAKRLVEIEEDQKKRLANELHDQIGRDLTALNLNLNFINTMLSGDAVKKVEMRITDSLTLLDGIVRHVRNIMSELRPEVLDEYGLLAALRWYGKQVSRRTGIQISIQGREDRRLPPDLEIALFRIAQEAVTNAAKHSSASGVAIKLGRTAKQTVFMISDNGTGFDVASERPHGEMAGLGLMIIRERAEAVGGTMHIDSWPGKGTTITVTVETLLR